MTEFLRAAALVTAVIIGITGCGVKKDAVQKQGESVEITTFMWELDGVGQDAGAPVYKALNEKFGIKISPSNTTYDQRNEKLNLLMASNSVPDVFIHMGFEAKATYDKWIKEGIVLPLDGYAGDYPNIKTVLDAFPNLAKLEKDTHYGIPVLSNGDLDALKQNTISNSHCLWIRKDWLKNLGLETPDNYTEFYEVCRAFTEDDPDGNGKKDTYGLLFGGSWWSYPFLNMFGASIDRYQEVDGRYESENISRGMRDAINYLHKMYYEKILDPDFVTIGDKVKEKFISGKVGVIPTNAGGKYTELYGDFKSAYPNQNPEDMFTWLEVLEGPGGIRRMDGSEAFWLMTSVKNGISDIKREKVLSLLEYMLSDEGQVLMAYGLEGEHYRKEGGDYLNLLPNGNDGKQQTIKNIDKTAGLFNYVAGAAKPAIAPKREHQDKINGSLAASRKYAVADPCKYVIYDTDGYTTAAKKELYSLTSSMITKAIMSGGENIDAEFDAYVAEWKSKGGDLMTKITNEQMAAQ
jgi:multiple sugar transport system substrate-binding protein/putative aldouronate transport system substrate-binding protein